MATKNEASIATQKAIEMARRKLARQETAVTDTKQLILALEEMQTRLTAK